MAESITLEKLSQLVEQAAKLKDEQTRIKVELDDVESQLKQSLGLIQSHLRDAGLNNFRTSRGMAVLNKRWSCKVPKEPGKKKQFFDWLKERGWYDEWITVNSNTLNSEYKKLYEEAAKEGELFEIPGVGSPTVVEYCTLRKG